MLKRSCLALSALSSVLLACDGLSVSAAADAPPRRPDAAPAPSSSHDSGRPTATPAPSPQIVAAAPHKAPAPPATRAPNGPRLPSTTSTWRGPIIQFFDFNGDGTLDFFGWIYDGRQPQAAAFDGATGRGLWTTPQIAADWSEVPVALIAGHVVVIDTGKAVAFKPGEEAPLWAVELGERAEEVCKGDAGKVVIRTKDQRVLGIDLTTGAASPASMPKTCTSDASALPAAIRTSRTRLQEVFSRTRRNTPRAPAIAGIDTEAVLAIGAKRVVLGDKTPGTRVPMVAVTQDQQVLWSGQVPEKNPLEASISSDAVSAADEHTVFIHYSAGSAYRIAALAVTDGRRLWDLELENSVESLVPVQDRLYVTDSWSLRALDRETGEHLYTIGRD